VRVGKHHPCLGCSSIDRVLLFFNDLAQSLQMALKKLICTAMYLFIRAGMEEHFFQHIMGDQRIPDGYKEGVAKSARAVLVPECCYIYIAMEKIENVFLEHEIHAIPAGPP